MKGLTKNLLLFLCLGLIFNTSVTAETKWITKKDSKTSKVKTLEQMYVDGLLSRNECIKAKKKILKSQSVPGCKKTETEEETVTYITKKKKSGKWGSPLCVKYNTIVFLSEAEDCSGYGGKYIIRKNNSNYESYFSKMTELEILNAKETEEETKTYIQRKKKEKEEKRKKTHNKEKRIRRT